MRGDSSSRALASPRHDGTRHRRHSFSARDGATVKLRIPALTKALDAGLLKTVEALLRAGQFPRVANLVAASEPLADFALRRMREIVGDQLLVRTAAGLELTRRARRLAAPFRDLLERIGEVLSGRDVFDPAFCEETFHVAASDYASFVLGPGLVARLAESAPRASILLSPLDVTAMRRPLETGALDLSLGPAPRGGAGRLKSEHLLAERFACIARKSHPRIGKRLTAKDYAGEGHAVVRAPAGAARTDPALADTGRTRRAAVTVTHFLLVPEIVAASDLIATLPERVAERFAERYPLVVHRSPVRPAGFSLAMSWHARTDPDPARAWLRQLVSDVAAAA
jgi:DNA-binding transcriptional LysR family regulator